MLKKTGIVVAPVATGLIAFTPFAFAGEKSDWDGHKVEHIDYKSDNSVDREQYNECSFSQNEGALSLLGELGGLFAEPAPAGPESVTNTQTQTQTGNCTNVGDTVGVGTPPVLG